MPRSVPAEQASDGRGPAVATRPRDCNTTHGSVVVAEGHGKFESLPHRIAAIHEQVRGLVEQGLESGSAAGRARDQNVSLAGVGLGRVRSAPVHRLHNIHQDRQTRPSLLLELLESGSDVPLVRGQSRPHRLRRHDRSPLRRLSETRVGQ